MERTSFKRPRRAVAVAALVAAVAASAAVSASGAAQAGDPAEKLNPASLAPKGIVGKGPNGETAATVKSVQLTAAEAAEARKKHFKVGIVMQTMDIDWSTSQVRGVTDTLKKYGASVIGVVDPQFKVDKQIAGIENMIQRKPDAIISIPVDDTATAPAYKKVAKAGIKLVFMDNVPRGLQWPKDYQSMASSDNQGDGRIAGQVLAQYIPKGGTIGIINFGVDFFVTNEREVGVRNWLKEHRPDIKVKRATFLDPSQAGDVAANFLTANPDVKGMFTTWEVPAAGILTALRQQGKKLPITSINLAGDVAYTMAQDGLIKGVGAQVPYDQGVAEALAALKALLGKRPPKWIALEAVPVIRKNLFEGYRKVFHKSPPAEIVEACKAHPGCG